jgi:hypothetical protein
MRFGPGGLGLLPTASDVRYAWRFTTGDKRSQLDRERLRHTKPLVT